MVHNPGGDWNPGVGGVVPTNTEGEDRCSKPQTSPEVWFLRVPNRTPILTFGIRNDWRMATGCQGGVGCGLWDPLLQEVIEMHLYSGPSKNQFIVRVP